MLAKVVGASGCHNPHLLGFLGRNRIKQSATPSWRKQDRLIKNGGEFGVGAAPAEGLQVEHHQALSTPSFSQKVFPIYRNGVG